MPKRWYISPIVGTGTDDDPYRAKVGGSALIKGHVSVIPTDTNGVPLFNFALVVVNAADHTPLIADSDNDVLPNKPNDELLVTSERILIRAILSRKGVPRALIDNAVTYGDFIRAIGRRLDQNFHENALDIG